MNEDSLVEAKRRLSLPDLMAMLGDGDRARKTAPCPFHKDSSPSFSVYRGQDGHERWKCHAGCGQGDAIDYLQRRRGLNLPAAIAEFIRMAGVEVPATPKAPSPAPVDVGSAFDWAACLAASREADVARLAAGRGYSPEFVAWLHRQGWVGTFKGQIALPVQSEDGHIIGCHFRLPEGGWRYFPTGIGTHPLVLWKPLSIERVFAFESQWDAFAITEILGWHTDPPSGTAVIATRGAANGRQAARHIPAGAVVYAFVQNDDPGRKWLQDIANAHAGAVREVKTPSPHKDANDWTRAGGRPEEIHAAIQEALPVPKTGAIPPEASAPSPAEPPRQIELPPDDQVDDAPKPFPTHLLPPTVAAIVREIARVHRVPEALPGITAIGVVSAAIGSGLQVISGPQRTTRANLFLIASAESGTGKSETFRMLASPILEAEEVVQEQWRKHLSPLLQAELRTCENQLKRLDRQIGKTEDSRELDRLKGQVKYLIAKRDELLNQNHAPLLVGQDITTERLAVVLEQNGETLLSASADARKLVDNILGRYAKDRTDEGLYLSAFSGDHIRVDRQGRPAVVLRRPCLALLWWIQPDALESLLDEASLSASGFLPRCLLAHTRAEPTRIEGETPILATTTIQGWRDLVESILMAFRLPPNSDGSSRPSAPAPRTLTPSLDATAVLVGYHNAIVDRRQFDLTDIGPFTARWAEQAWRLLVVLHAAKHMAQAADVPVDVDTARQAVELAEWFADCQISILTRGRRANAAKIEDEVLELLEENRTRRSRDFITAREVQRARISPTAEAAHALLSRMEQDGILVSEEIRPAQGGKPTRIYRTRNRNPVPG
ncbi:MAG: DUF3987 domain-containing protein [Limisphaerales bacterium]